MRTRTFKGSLIYGEPGYVELRRNSKGAWICIYDGHGTFHGSIDGVANLRRLAESILEALPPKRGAGPATQGAKT